AGVAAGPTTEDQEYPRLAPDGNGGAFVVWIDQRGSSSSYHIYAQHVLGDGTIATGWPTTGLPVCRADGNQNIPQALGDGSGGAFFIWGDDRDGGSVFAQRVDASGAVAPGWVADGVPAITGYAVSPQISCPSIVSDGSGGAYIASSLGWAVAQHILATGAMAPGWPASGKVLGHSEESCVVADGSGGAFFG